MGPRNTRPQSSPKELGTGETFMGMESTVAPEQESWEIKLARTHPRLSMPKCSNYFNPDSLMRATWRPNALTLVSSHRIQESVSV